MHTFSNLPLSLKGKKNIKIIYKPSPQKSHILPRLHICKRNALPQPEPNSYPQLLTSITIPNVCPNYTPDRCGTLKCQEQAEAQVHGLAFLDITRKKEATHLFSLGRFAWLFYIQDTKCHQKPQILPPHYHTGHFGDCLQNAVNFLKSAKLG